MARGSLHRDAPRAETIDRTVATERAFRLSAKAAPSGAALSTFSYAARPMRSADRMSSSRRRNTGRNTAQEHTAVTRCTAHDGGKSGRFAIQIVISGRYGL